MTHEDIIKFAQEAGFNPVTYSGGNAKLFCSFAALLTAAERRKHQADIERWKTEATNTEKWRGLRCPKMVTGAPCSAFSKKPLLWSARLARHWPTALPQRAIRRMSIASVQVKSV